MSRLLSSGIIFALWVMMILFLYYTHNTSHASLLQGAHIPALIGYIALAGITIGVSSYAFISEKKPIKWTLWHIVMGFFLSLFVTSIIYGLMQRDGGIVDMNPFILFFSLVKFLIYPIFLVFLWRALGSSLFFASSYWRSLPLRLRVPIETSLGFGIFAFVLFFLGYTGNLTLTGLIITLILLSVAGFFGWKQTINDIKHQAISFSENTPISYILSAQIAFAIFSFVASVSLINAFRPMPIGWDDLGVYMNFPRIMAETGILLEWAGMYAWHLVTSSGFLFNHTATQAFFVNQIGGFLATLTIVSILSLLMETLIPKEKKSFALLCLPALLGIVYYIMPMTVFQQAKDMKLDPALMFLSVSALWSLISGGLIALKQPKNRKWIYIFFGIAGIITGLAFSVKFTTLMLILSSLAYMSFLFLGMSGLIGFTGIFIATFTGLGLWNHLFVWMPTDSSTIVITSLIIGIFSYGVGIFRSMDSLRTYISSVLVFLTGLVLILTPWIVKNYTEIRDSGISISGLLSGGGGYFMTDFSHLYSEEVVREKQDAIKNISAPDESGKTINEDFSRYFGQESGLNNYIKLPFHLTLQSNQKGEFTDITYIFLAFVPVSLLFFSQRRGRETLWITGILLFLFGAILSGFHILFPNSSLSAGLTALFASVSLPWAYAVLIVLVFGFLTLAHISLRNDTPEYIMIRAILVITAFYGLIFWVSAFGIVWYGVLIYFLLLLVIAIGLSHINTLHPGEPLESSSIKRHIILFVSITLGIYVMGSAMMHASSNLHDASYNEYKYGLFSQDISIFMYKPDYFLPLATLNLENPSKLAKDIQNHIESSSLAQEFARIPEEYRDRLEIIHQYLSQWFLDAIQTKNHIKRSAIEPILSDLYAGVLYPAADNRNTSIIHRVGTFMTYFIHNNRLRYYDDSLIFGFENFLYDANPQISTDRMKATGIQHMLIDLNAATIDKDPRRALTERYEHLLLTLRSPDAHLIATDSTCLRVAVDEYKNGELQDEREFLNIAGVNYVSYTDGKILYPQQKRALCAEYIMQNIAKRNIDEQYPYLRSYAEAMSQAKTQADLERIFLPILQNQSWFALAEIK